MLGNIEYYLFGDTETTGLSPYDSQPIEAAFILTNKKLEVLGKLSLKINFEPELGTKWCNYSEQVHGIPMEVALGHGISQEKAVFEIFKFVHSHVWPSSFSGVYLAGCNSAFDYYHLTEMRNRVQRKVADGEMNTGVPGMPFSYRLVDINQVGMVILNENTSKAIADTIGLEINESKAHSAEYDAQLHYDLFKGIIKHAGLE